MCIYKITEYGRYLFEILIIIKEQIDTNKEENYNNNLLGTGKNCSI